MYIEIIAAITITCVQVVHFVYMIFLELLCEYGFSSYFVYTL